MNVCTIIAKNYVAHARVLARSLTENHPGDRLWTLVIDDFSRYIDPAQEPFEVLTPAEIGCEPFIHMALRYSVLELSTAVKPWLLRHLMGETGGPVTYLDPDIKIYGSLERFEELATRHGVVLIPHNSDPIPADGRKPSQVDIMISGVYNLGYVSLAPGPEVDRLLDWWADRLRRDCRVDPMWGYFVDQRWFDLTPGFVTDLAIVRDPEYNVAYWNLHGRRLEYDAGGYLVDGRPLAFFHFSGFDPEHPLILSRHQNRLDVLDHAVLEQLLAEYAAEVMAEGHAVSRRWPYSYGALADGTRLDDRLRDLYDDFADEHDGEVLSPFTLEGMRTFERWLKEPAPGAPAGINRVLARIYEERSDLRGAYPDLNGSDRAGLLRWAEEYGSREVPQLARLMTNTNGPLAPLGASVRRALPATSNAAEERDPISQDSFGVNVVGYFRSELGTGEAARQLVGALDARGISVLPIHGQTLPVSRQGHSYVTAAPEDAVFPVNVICMNADMLPEFASQVGEEFFAGRYSIGLWFWEVARFPERWRSAFSLVEEVWAPTAHVAAALEPLANVPVTTVRIPVQPQPFEPCSRVDLGLPEERFLFLFSFDYLSVFERKNPIAVIEAFRRAFVPGEGAQLLLKCINHERDSGSHTALCAAAAGHPDIAVIDRYMSPSDNSSLTAMCDCYVSLHRAEGFGLVMAEAMFRGKPVIATGYSGNLDFMTASNSLLVEHRLVPIGPGADPYPADGKWADPDVEHASTLLRQVFDDHDRARELGARAAEDIRRTHSPTAAGEIMHRRLESIRATGRARRAVDPMHGRLPALAKLPLRIRQGPNRGAVEGRGAPVRDLARRIVLRVMRPYTAYQQTINADLVASLDGLSEWVVDVRQESAAERAKQMAEARGIETGTRVIDDIKRETDEIKRILILETDRSVYLTVSELEHRHAPIAALAGELPETLDLTRFELRAFSQNGEDGVLAEILRRTGAPTRFFVEFGVESGREGNCVYFADVAGWRGLFLEAEAELYRLLERKYVAQGRVQTIRAQVNSGNVEQLFGQAEVPLEPDVLSIDVDGHDYWIWEAIENYHPRVVVIEYNSALDPRRRLVQPNDPTRPWDGTDYYGASLGALQALGDRKGYRLVHTELSGVNAFFVRADLAGEAFPDQGDVAVRGVPNYFQSGYRHPAAKPGKQYLDLDSGKLVEGAH